MIQKKEKQCDEKTKNLYTDRYKTALDISKIIKEQKKTVFLSSFFSPISINMVHFQKDKQKDYGDTQINFIGGFL